MNPNSEVGIARSAAARGAHAAAGREVAVDLAGAIAEVDMDGAALELVQIGGRVDFALPEVFAEDEENVFRVPGFREVDEFLGAFQVEFAHGFVEVDESDADDGKRDDRQIELRARARDELDFAARNGGGLGENIHAIEAESRERWPRPVAVSMPTCWKAELMMPSFMR